MPWNTDADVDRHNKGLSAKQKKVWREVANSELASHGDDARAIKAANAAVSRIKESMDYAEIDRLFSEASKVLHMDASHDAIRSRIQDSVSTAHRLANAGSDSASYYNTPYVRDVFGDENSGTVVHSKDGKLTASKYKKGASGYELSNHKPVKQAYVSDSDADDKKESWVMIDGREVMMQEAVREFSEIIELQEAAKSGVAKITLITAGRGSMGVYKESALKKAANDKIFNTGTQMFLNHQTKEERAARPEGDITKLAAKLTGPAEYVEGANGSPGRLVAPAKIYPEFSDFIGSRKDDIGVSVRVGVTPSGKVEDGLPVVESMAYALSADFVTKAGRGGKIEEMYESFRAALPGVPRNEENMTDEEKKLFKDLQESGAKNSLQIDRLMEQNAQLMASNIISESLRTSGLPARGQERVRKMILATVPMKDGALDSAKLEESIKAAVTDEKAYLQESGVRLTSTVTRLGASGIELLKESGEPKDDGAILAEASKVLDSSVSILMGKEIKTA